MKDENNIDFKFREKVFPFVATIFLKVRNDATKTNIINQIVTDLHNNNISDLIQIDYLANYLDNPIGFIDGIIDYYRYLQIDFQHKTTQIIEKQAENESFETSKELENLRKVEIERFADKCNDIIDYCNGLKANYKPTQPKQSPSSKDNRKRNKKTFFDIFNENEQLQTIIKKAEEKGLLRFCPDAKKCYWLKAEQDLYLFAYNLNWEYKDYSNTYSVGLKDIYLIFTNENGKQFKNPRTAFKRYSLQHEKAIKDCFPNPQTPQF